jgi:hypothetical protein
MLTALKLTLDSMVTQTARLARDLWNKVNDVWENEHRVWEDII